MTQMARILITGATGFVGRRLCKVLRDQGHAVLAVVRDATTDCASLPADETIPMGELGGDTPWDTKLLDRVDAIVHLAARVHVLKDEAVNPSAEFQRVNVGATEALARAAAGRVKRFVYVSSLHAMRTLTTERLTEASVCEPNGPYSQSKLDAEAVVRQIGRETGLETVIVRPPPIYGPGHRGRLMSLFQFAKWGLPLPLGGIDNRRSLVFVDNLASALLECAVNPLAVGQTFLISDGEDVSLSELVARMGRALGRRIWLLPAPVGLIRRVARLVGKSDSADRLFGSLVVDSQFIRRQLDWQPPHSMDAGLQVTANWMKGAA